MTPTAAATHFDVIVIGAGPGGQIAATRAAQLGFSTACIDDWKNAEGGPAPGGTCTNVGCIPAKALLQSSEYYEIADARLAEHGIGFSALRVDIPAMLARKAAVVKKNNDGILYLFRKNKITFFHGKASFDSIADGPVAIRIAGSPDQVVTGTNIIVATGSSPRPLPGLPFDETRILSNDGALRLPEVPRTLGVIGAGVVGLELGSVWRRLGADVTVLEALPAFLGSADEQIAKEAKKAFDKQGLKIVLGAQVLSVAASADGVTISYSDAVGATQSLSVERLIVSIGRLPNTAGLLPENAGLSLDSRGALVVDAECRTNIPNIWAIGDVVRGPMLAHKAEDEGTAVAERIAGQHTEVDFNTVPWVIYTHPEIAWVGQTEQQLKAAGRAYRAGTFPFMANGRARAMGDTVGFAKVLADEATNQILGVHLIGPMVSELIAQGVAAMEFRADSEEFGEICQAHPTLSEALKEASLAVNQRALNF